MILQVFVDLVDLQFFPSLEVLAADVAGVDLEVDLAVVVVEEVGPWEGHVASFALLLGVVVVDVVLQLAVAAHDLAARLTHLALGRLGVHASDVAVTLRLFRKRSKKERVSNFELGPAALIRL